MIVRNESAVIARCLSSVKRWITHWVIVDTGSIDDTTSIIQDQLRDIPGRLVETDWTDDFAQHRNEAIAVAQAMVSSPTLRLFFIDADEVLHVDRETAFRRQLASRRFIEWWAVSGDWHFRKLAIVVAADVDRWVGVRHEYLRLRPKARVRPAHVISEAWIEYGDDGFRRRDDEFLESDLARLQDAADAEVEGDTVFRKAFFLARTHEAKGDWSAAAGWFARAAGASAVDSEDQWQSIWGQGRCLRHVDLAAAARCFQMASELAPDRAEPLLALAEIARIQGLAEQAVTLARAALACDTPRRTAMYDASAYGWRAADELALAAAELGDRVIMQSALVACEAHFANSGRLPALERERLLGNLEKLRQQLA